MKTKFIPAVLRGSLSAFIRIAVCATAFITSEPLLHASTNLPIRNRTQWLENDGYCGETSIQEVGLYHGLYVSQFYVRNIFDPSQVIDLAEQENWIKVCDKLRLKYKFFIDLESPTPQFRLFSGWVKRELRLGHPVILAAWISGGDDVSSHNPPFAGTVDQNPFNQIDHFITAAGYVGSDDDKYNGSDLLFITNHYFSTYTWAQRFNLLFDTRENTGNAKTYSITLPKNYCLGVSIPGTTAIAGSTLPVRLELDRIDEPNLITGEAPVGLNATITVTNLTPGKTYVLYRYNNPDAIPLKGFSTKPFDKKVVFSARKNTKTLSDIIRSDSFAAYRCVPLGK